MMPKSEQQSQSLSASVQSQQLPDRIWIQLPLGAAVRIPIKQCEIVDDLKEVIRNKPSPELNDVPVHKINLYTSSDQNAIPLRPGIQLSSLFVGDNYAGKHDDNPLYIRIIQNEKPISAGQLKQSIQ